jgi:autotransporter-associated beta strand protein
MGNVLRFNYTYGRFSQTLPLEFATKNGRNLSTKLGLPSGTPGGMPVFNAVGGNCSSRDWENVMRKYALFGLLVVYLLSVGFDWLKRYLPVALMASPAADAPRQMENLGRGVVAVRSSATEVLVSWRLLGYEPQDLPFNVYRSTGDGPAQRLNAEPLTGGTNLVDATADPSAPNSYFVRPVINGIELAASVMYTLPANAPVRPYLTFPLQSAPDTYVHLIWVGDLDGDGEYDFIVSRLPLNSGRQFIDAYRRDGAFLWRVDFGPNSVNPDNIEPPAAAINAGHNDGVTVYDLDSDGRAEVVIKSANGVVFGDGRTLVAGDNVTQFISVLDGLTGAERARAPVPADYITDGPVAGHFGVAYLDGVKPSFIFKAKNRVGNGGFNLFIAAWDFDGTNLTQRWKWLRGDQNCPDDHQIRIVDVDRDGRDEICDGGYVLDDDGSLLYTLGPQGVIHGDRFHIADLDPDRPGLEGFAIQQNNPSGLLYFIYDAADGTILRRHFGGIEDTARGTAADISAPHRGYEYWSFHGIHEIKSGELISPDPQRPWPNFRIWWDGDVMSENLNREFVEKWDPSTGGVIRLLTASEDGALDSWRDAAQFYGDIIGDWREEVVFENSAHTALLIYTTPIPSETRLYTLPHNPEYRACFTVKGYLQSNMVDYYLGDGMAPPPPPNITPVIPASSATPVITSFDSDTGAAADDRITNDNTPALSGAAPPNARIIVSRLGAGDDGATAADGSGAWSFTYLSPLPDGQHHLLARVDDGRDNFSFPFAIQIDTVPPAAPTIAVVVAGSPDGFVVHGHAEPGLRVEVAIEEVGTIGTAVAQAGGAWSVPYTGAALPAGTYTFSAVALDIAGNSSTAARRVVDLTAGAPAITALSDDTGVSATDHITADRTIVLSGTASPGAEVSVFRFGTGVLGTARASAGGAWTFDYGGAALADGAYAFTAFSGRSVGAPTFNVVIDGAAPAVMAINRLSPSAASSSASEVTCRVLFNEAVAGVDQTDFTLALGAGLTGAIASVRPAGSSAFDVVIGPLSGEGAVFLSLNATGTGVTDLAGNPLPGGLPAVQIFTRVLLGDGVWARTTSGGLWGDNANWVGGIVAHGASTTANFSAIEIPEDIIVRLDAPRTVTNLIFGDDDVTSPASWMIDDNGDATNTLTLVSGAAAPNITVNPLSPGAIVRIAAPLAGSNGFTKAGAGTLALAAPGALTGTVGVTAGVVRLDPGATFAPGTINISTGGATLQVAGGTLNADGTANVTGSNSNLVIDSGIANFNTIAGSNNTGSRVLINGGTVTANSVSFMRSTDSNLNYNTGLIVRGGNATIGTINLGTANSNGMMSVEGGMVTAAGAITLGNQSTGGRGGHLRVINDGVFNSTDGSPNGGLIITRRNNNASTANFLGGVSAIEKITLGYDAAVMSGSGTLNVNGGALYVGAGGIVSNAGGTFAANVILAAGLLGAKANWSTLLPITLSPNSNIVLKAADAANVPHDITIGGPLGGAGGFTKIAGGRLTLGGVNTFTGAVAVNGGVLEIAGSLTAGAAGADLSVNAGGMLTGDGTINRAIILNPGGTVMPVSAISASSLTASSLTWNPGAVLAFDLDAGSNQLVLTGPLTKGGTGPHRFVFRAGPGIAAGNSYKLVTFGSTDFTAADFTFSGLPPGLTGAFFVNANEIAFKVYGPPVILAPPLDATVLMGGTATFSVSAGEFPALSYQWFKNGGPIAGEISPSLTIANAQGFDIGSYHVVVTNAAGSTASGAAALSIKALALVNRGPSLNSAEVEGSIQQLLGTNAALNGDMTVNGNLMAPGTPAVIINGRPAYGGTIDSAGSEGPTGYTVTINSGTTLNHVVRRTDPVALPVVSMPVAPSGTRNVIISNPAQSVGDWATVRNLTLNGNVGQFAVPAGAYGTFAINGNGSLVLGVPGATMPSVYYFRHLSLNSGAQVQVAGPVLVVVENGCSLSGSTMGSVERPEWLTLHIASGGLTLNSSSEVHGYVVVPGGQVTINNNSKLSGGLAADRLTLNSHGLLKLRGPAID